MITKNVFFENMGEFIINFFSKQYLREIKKKINKIMKKKKYEKKKFLIKEIRHKLLLLLLNKNK